MITVLLSALSLLTLASLLAWFYILLHPARPWDFQPVGDDAPLGDPPADWPAVTVLVPARNEAESLPNTLPALLSQDYPGQLCVTVIDDRSSDGTADVARAIAAKLNCTERLTVVSGAPLPAGWVGKMWALDQGARHSLKTRTAQFVLLTDADILHASQSLRRLVSESVAGKLALNSRMARLRCESSAEKLLIPPFVYFFNLLYPMRRVNHPNDRLAAAAGGCVLLSAEALEKMGGGFEPIKNEFIDDVNLGRTVKGFGQPIRLAVSRTEVVSLREYPHIADIWKMVSRTAFTELQYSWPRLFGAMLGLALLFIVPLIAIIAGLAGSLAAPDAAAQFTGLWAFTKGALCVMVMQRVFGPAVEFFRLPLRYRFTLPYAGVLYGLMTLDSALRHARGEGPGWRDKNAPPVS